MNKESNLAPSTQFKYTRDEGMRTTCIFNHISGAALSIQMKYDCRSQ